MISICIPIYNRDVRKLVQNLYKQALDSGIVFEILLIDDTSDIEIREKNRLIPFQSDIRYEELPFNIGRSSIRNLFVKKALYPYLIFIDNDAEVCSDNFINEYKKQCIPDIICYGGCVYQENVNKEDYLRWFYGKNREAVSFEKRIKRPNDYFSSFNFLIDRNIMKKCSFDENLKGYGYEDVLFKSQLIKKGYHIVQINNPLIHIGLMSGDLFLKKTEESLAQLMKLEKDENVREIVSQSVKLLQIYNRIKCLKLTKSVSYIYTLLQKTLKKNLLSDNPRLFAFDLYKIGYFCRLQTEERYADSETEKRR